MNSGDRGVLAAFIGGIFLLISIWFAWWLQNSPSPIPPPTPTFVSTVAPSTTVAPSLPPTDRPVQSASSSGGVDCNIMEEVKPPHNPQWGVPWILEPYNEDRIIEIWSNHHPNNLPVHLYFLPAGERVEFISGGGVEYRDRPGCNFATGEYERKKNNPRPPINYQQYEAYINEGKIP